MGAVSDVAKKFTAYFQHYKTVNLLKCQLSELELEKDFFKTEYENLRDQQVDAICKIPTYQKQIDEQRQQNQKLTASIKTIAESVIKSYVYRNISMDNAEKVYGILQPVDREGWCLWQSCFELLNIKPCDFFYAEDNMGYFEEANGYKNTKWAEIAAFADCEYEERSGGYEVLVSYNFDNHAEEYQKYRNSLYFNAVANILNSIDKQLKDIIEASVDNTPCQSEYPCSTLTDLESIIENINISNGLLGVENVADYQSESEIETER